MATTQDGRLLKITTPLGKDFLMVNRLTANEALSELFTYEVELVHEENEMDYKPTLVDVNALMGQQVSIEIKQRDNTTRMYNGIVNRFSQGTRNPRFSYYYMTIVPQAWVLTRIQQSRIFQHKTVPDILKEVFKDLEVAYELQGDFKPRNYCVQFRESDFDFASRLMEEEGIFYYFEHSGSSHKMIVANTPQSNRDCPSKSEIPYFLMPGDQEDFVTSIHRWHTDYQLQSGKVTFWDHNFQLPTNKLDAEQPSRFNIGNNQSMEIYDYPGGYSRKVDGIDRTGGENAGDLQNVFNDKKNQAELAMQAIDAEHKTASGSGDCCAMTAGYRFQMTKHPGDSNGQYVITSVTHEAEQNPTYISDEESEQPYTNSFRCLSHGSGAPPFRPSRKTPKPTVKGSQTALVVGPAGEEIFTDKYGRVKVQFYWDRQGKNDADSSCWCRVGTLWAGKQWGVVHIPRIGQEVIVDFLEGDPDQPIIVGSVYNPETMPPYTLPDNKTQSGVKSRSSKGGSADNFNEFRFEDLKGSEQVYLHAEKNYDIVVENDETHLVMHDRTKTIDHDETVHVKHNRTETVDFDETITINKNRTETVIENETVTVVKNHTHTVNEVKSMTVGKSETLSVGEDKTDNIGGNHTLLVTKDSLHSGTQKITITAGTELILQGPGGQIKIDGTGVTIQGVLVKIN